MRETRTVQSSIFDFYSKHDHGALLIEIPPQYMECIRCLDLVSLASSY